MNFAKDASTLVLADLFHEVISDSGKRRITNAFRRVRRNETPKPGNKGDQVWVEGVLRLMADKMEVSFAQMVQAFFTGGGSFALFRIINQNIERENARRTRVNAQNIDVREFEPLSMLDTYTMDALLVKFRAAWSWATTLQHKIEHQRDEAAAKKRQIAGKVGA